MYPKTLVIIPLSNVGSSSEDEYFGDGITDELLVTLNRIKGIKILSRTSSFYLKNKRLSVSEIAETLGVHYILEGSVRKIENSARITVQLIEVENETVLLSEVYETELGNVFEVQVNIALKIAGQLKGVFDETMYLNPVIKNSKAYDFYLKGNYHWYRYTKNEVNMAVSYFKRSINLEPEFALAHSGLAKAYVILGAMGYSRAHEVFPKARKATQKALLFNNKLVEPHLSFSWVSLFYEWDLPMAIKHINQCIKLDPNNAAAYDIFSKYYIMDGKLGKAEDESLKSIELDPMGLTYHANLFRIYFYMGKYDQALNICEGSLKIDSSFLPALEQKGWIYVFLGEFEKAIEIFELFKDKSNNSIDSLSGLGFAYARSGYTNECFDCLKEIEKETDLTKEAIEFKLSIVNIGLRRYDAVYKNIKYCIDNRLGILVGELLCNPIFHELKTEERFIDLFQDCVQSKNGLFPDELTDNVQPSVIQINSNTSEKLMMDPNDLLYIKADDNYARVFWKEGNKLNEKLLRITLTRLDKQFNPFPFIVRCHKSFIINLKEEYTVTGNTKGYKFKSVLSPQHIPVSRSKGEKVIRLYKQLQI